MLQKRTPPKKPAETQPATPAPAQPEPEAPSPAVPSPEPETPAVTQPAKVSPVVSKPAPKTTPPTFVNQRPPAQRITNYRKRQQVGPFIIWGLVAILIIGGLIILLTWLFGTDGPVQTMLATETPTATATFTVTPSSTPTSTPTETPTATVTLTPTPSAPFTYEIQSGDTLYGLQEKFGLADDFLCTIGILNPGIDINNISLGQRIMLPNPGLRCPTPTPIDFTTLRRGAEVEYTIQNGDTIAGIASRFNSTAEDILELNDITDANTIFVGQVIKVRVNLVTPTITPNPTITPGPTVTPGIPAALQSPTAELTVTPTP